jgi:acyl-CoA synthetase (AMP-forming)/AMP-acid ligase II
VIYELPEVREAAVLPIQDTLVAFISLHKGASLAPGAVVAHCRRFLPASHVPGQVVMLEALPHNALGAVLKRELEQSWKE